METKEKNYQSTGIRLARELYDRSLLEQQARFLINNHEKSYDLWEAEPDINARTALFEELTAKGHLSEVEFDEPADIANQQALQRQLNARSEELPLWEQERRFNEIIEELTLHKVWEDMQAGILPPDTIVITISNYPEGQSGKEPFNMGYRELNKKGMVRGTDFNNGKRRVRQISRSNSNDQSTALLFELSGLNIDRHTSTNYLGNQIIATQRDLPNGIIDVQRALDSLAGPNVIYGENRNQPDLNVPEYDDLLQVSKAREAQLKHYTKELADLERSLNIDYAADQISYNQKLDTLYAKRKQIVDKICVLDPSYAKDARGEESVAHFENAAEAMAAGDDVNGVLHFEKALEAADPRAGVVCGGNGKTDSSNTKNSTLEKYMEAKADREKWKWKRGKCIVPECPTRPDKVDVGPCSVCRKCQTIYDKGDDPKTVYMAINFLEWIFGLKESPKL